MEPTPAILRLKVTHAEPLELKAFGDCFSAWSSEYSAFIDDHESSTTVPKVRLYISKVRAGSIVADLVALAPLALPFMENANTIVGFAGHMRSMLNALLHRTRQDRPIPRHTLQNVGAIIEPVARDNAAQLNVQTVINQTTNVYLKLDSVQANAIQNAARRELEPDREAATGTHTQVLLYLHQARNDPHSRAGDRAVIESISPLPVKTVFVTDQLKAQIIHGSDNPFRCAFVVDVEVGTLGGSPALYKVLALHDTFERPEAA